MQALAVEREIGIETFFSQKPGIKGILRSLPADFRVIEIAKDFSEKEKGKFTIAKITAENWETNHLISVLSKRLRVSRKRISFAGTKDKRSISTQFFSFYRLQPQKIRDLQIKDVSVEEVFYSDESLHIGDLIGNSFHIIIRNLDSSVDTSRLTYSFEPFEKWRGFPNFFGVQRFGIIRPITHVVGKWLVKGDFKKAVLTYLTELFDGEEKDSFKSRKNLAETLDFQQALIDFPDHLQFEKAMLNHLVVHPTDYIGALKQLPNNLITMFVYAYQSYLFNKILSKRIQNNLPLHHAVEGDIILPVRKDVIKNEYIPVTGNNIEKVNRQLDKRKGFVSGILVGSNTIFSNGIMGEIEHKIIEKEHIDYRDFIIPELPIASSYGTRRAIFAPLDNLSFSLIDDTFYENKKAAEISFQLLKGCYATSFLREIMKADEITNY